MPRSKTSIQCTSRRNKKSSRSKTCHSGYGQIAVRDQVPTGLATKAASEIANVNSDNRWVKYGPFDLGIAITDEREVHSMSRGQAVFELICQNCHGVNYDSKSPLAQTVGELSGGGAIVANFRSGLFGPESSPGAFANAEFTFSEGNTGASAEEWQARYLLFMGLGGTQATIPQEVLSLISSSPFYGQAASTVGVSDGTTFGANMLQPAQAKCVQILTTPITIPLLVADKKFHPIHDMTGIGTPFAVNTGHYQLWESLCNHGQAPMVRVLNLEGAKLLQGTNLARTFSFYSVDRLGRPLYPSDALVGDQLGPITPGIQPGNVLPWCVNATDAQIALSRKRLGRRAQRTALGDRQRTAIACAHGIEHSRQRVAVGDRHEAGRPPPGSA